MIYPPRILIKRTSVGLGGRFPQPKNTGMTAFKYKIKAITKNGDYILSAHDAATLAEEIEYISIKEHNEILKGLK